MGPTEFVLNVVANILGDAAFAIGLAGVAIALSGLVWRRRVRRFFGVRPHRSSIHVKLSNLYVQRTKANVPITTGFQGPAMQELEYRYALRMARQIETKPLVRALSARLDDIRGSWSDPVICDIGLSPDYRRGSADDGAIDFASDSELVAWLKRDLASGTFVLVGASVYNLMTYYVTTRDEAAFEFTLAPDKTGVPQRAITVRRFHSDKGPEAFPREFDAENKRWLDHFIVQKITRDETVIFICAGTCASGTVAALRELAAWPALARRFGDRPFAALYEFVTYDTEGEPVWDSIQEHWVRPSASAS